MLLGQNEDVVTFLWFKSHRHLSPSAFTQISNSTSEKFMNATLDRCNLV